MLENNSNFAVVRFAKLKTTGQMSASASHNFRKEQPTNADPTKAHLNEELIELESKNYVEAFKKKIEEHGITPRQDSVKMLEVMMTFTGEDEEMDLEEWKKRSVEWVNNYFGKNNVVSAVYHGDESSPHIHAVVVPIVDGRLYASEYINGREKCAAMQTSYADSVSDLGLERGMENSPVTYKTMQQLRAATEKVASEVLPPPHKGESIENYYARVNEVYQNERLAAYKKQSELTVQAEKKVEEYRRVASAAQKEKKETIDSIAPLVKENRELKNTVAQKEKDIKRLQTDYAEYLGDEKIKEKDIGRLFYFKQAINAFEKGKLGEETAAKKQEFINLLDEAVAADNAYSDDKDMGELMDTREENTEIDKETTVADDFE